MNTRILSAAFAAAVIAVTAFAAPQAAQADVTVRQCNFPVDSVYVPGLFVTIDGRIYRVLVGERGLRRGNLYERRRIEIYVRNTFSIGLQTEVAVSVGCGLAVSPDRTLSAGVPPPPEPEPTPEPTTVYPALPPLATILPQIRVGPALSTSSSVLPQVAEEEPEDLPSEGEEEEEEEEEQQRPQ